MKLSFPSREFDDAVAGVCHGSATETEMRALNELLRGDPKARDEYLLRVELHARLASDPDLFARGADSATCPLPDSGPGERLQPISLQTATPVTRRRAVQAWAIAASIVFIAGTVLWLNWPAGKSEATSNAVAMLTRAVDARWAKGSRPLRAGSPLEPGSFRLERGLAQIVFYSGARVIIEGPAELQVVTAAEARCSSGRLLLEVPPAARGFRLKTPQMNVVDLGTSFGVDASGRQTEVHVFKGKVEFSGKNGAKQLLGEGRAALVRRGAGPQLMAASSAIFTPLFEFQERSLALEAFRYEQWQFASARLNQDPSLVLRLDFEEFGGAGWALRNTAEKNQSVPEAAVVGCVRAQGRWREKQALELQSVNDRVRFAVPGHFEALTFSVWICIKGLDRQFNSLFMSDGFDPGTPHWLIRNDGVLGLTLFGQGSGKFQIMASPPLVTLDQIGTWVHLAAVLDGATGEASQYVNGNLVARHKLKFHPPFQIGSAELGNWNTRDPNPAPGLMRNLSGAIDEFALFSRALSAAEIQKLHTDGKPDP